MREKEENKNEETVARRSYKTTSFMEGLPIYIETASTLNLSEGKIIITNMFHT